MPIWQLNLKERITYMKIYKILGKRGRITIPYEIRQSLDFEEKDVISFEPQDDGTVIISAEPLCCACHQEELSDLLSLRDILDELPVEAKRDALVYLSMQLAMSHQDEGGIR
jgi:bifunctional DNA-binding transcriptional regulator/antitoxin component of YhaV-PrlF toxin-antitoxin module